MPSMIISCPHCQTRFDVDENRFLPAGRSVRCSDCATSWFVPAPQAVEMLSPKSKIAPHGHHRNHDRAIDSTASMDNDLFDRFARNQDSANAQAMAQRRRKSDQIVDTDWQEVRLNQQSGQRSGQQSDQQPRPPLRRQPVEEPFVSPIDQIQQAKSNRPRRVGPDDAPGEVFAAINVQPRELERALRRVRRKAEAREKNRLTPLRVIGWMVLGCLTASTIFAGYHYRHDVVRMFPGTAKAYATIGINAKPYGLALEEIDYRVALSTTGPILEIKGQLHNRGDKMITTPLLQAEALDARGRLLASWTFAPAQSSVPGGSYTSFATRNPAPEGVVEVVLSFAPKKSRTEP